MPAADYDVVIAGGSIAGLTAATFFGRKGARVAVLEKSTDPDHYKVMCTHYVQASAQPTLERLGLLPEIERAGAIRDGARIWTRYGWADGSYDGDGLRNVSLRRQKLDPMLRRLAGETPGVDILMGHTVKDVIADGGRITGVRVTEKSGAEHAVRARLVVAADGRDSKLAQLARVPARVKPNNRFGYMAYYEGVRMPDPTVARLWFTDPDVGYTFPNDDGQTIVAAFVTKDKLAEWKRDPEGHLLRFIEGLDQAPDLSGVTRVSKMLGKLDMPNRQRPGAARGMAFAGDAAIASDPLYGIGCGWALQSAGWLAEETADAVVGGGDLDAALERYRIRHRKALNGHHFLISDYSSGRRFTPLERILFAGAAKDPVLAENMRLFGERIRSPREALRPAIIARAVRTVGLRPKAMYPDPGAIAETAQTNGHVTLPEVQSAA